MAGETKHKTHNLWENESVDEKEQQQKHQQDGDDQRPTEKRKIAKTTKTGGKGTEKRNMRTAQTTTTTTTATTPTAAATKTTPPPTCKKPSTYIPAVQNEKKPLHSFSPGREEQHKREESEAVHRFQHPHLLLCILGHSPAGSCGPMATTTRNTRTRASRHEPVEVLESGDDSLGGLISGSHVEPLTGVLLPSLCRPQPHVRPRKRK